MRRVLILLACLLLAAGVHHLSPVAVGPIVGADVAGKNDEVGVLRHVG